ncbi:3280_t:CDS:10 [Acaulospora morrowiae]|uniref:Mannosyltransferase n=1 Tax=Acaulospora morrowiae TaxID=94023 RepID=A0A9N8Z7W2_9GLOM|nr:3280_t:CDS:10 [Acaulospora morrowiae]
MSYDWNNLLPYFYFLLCVIRLWCSLLPGYIHPDEFFQSPEIMGEDVLGFEVYRPWEFEQSPQCRSIVIPALTIGLPFKILKTLNAWDPRFDFSDVISSRSIFLTERLSFFCLSFVIDYTAYTIANSYYPRNTFRSLLVFASSYVLLIFHTRSFSNAVESIILALCIVVYVKGSTPSVPHKRKQDDRSSVPERFCSTYAFILGSLAALGCFTRITFILYAFPLGLAFLHHVFIAERIQQKSWLEKLTELIPACLGLVFTTVVCVLIDSLYFGTLSITLGNELLTKEHLLALLINPMRFLEIGWKGELIFTPLNNFIYNIDTRNLTEHGLHPRYLHIVNFVLLFGPLVLLTMKDLNASYHCKRFMAKRKYKTEPRFLLPLLIPVIIVPSDKLQKLPKPFWVAWAIFNLIFVMIYGLLHQAGIIPTIQKLQFQAIGFRNCEEFDGCVQCDVGRRFIRPVRNSSETFVTNIIFYKTYMPPRHLFGYPKTWRSTNIQLNIYDLAGGSIQSLEKLISKQVAPKRNSVEAYKTRYITFQQRLSGNVTLRQYERTLLVTPSTTDLSLLFSDRSKSSWEQNNQNDSGDNNFELILTDQHWPHLNLDQLDNVFTNGMFLNVYALVRE